MNSAEFLQPSLSGRGIPPKLYSLSAMLFVAFFGGILAIIPFSLLNMKRFGSLQKDWFLPTLGVVVGMLTVGAYLVLYEPKGQPQWLMRFAFRSLGLAYVGLFYLRYRAIFRVVAVYGAKNASPWIPGLLCMASPLVIGTLIGMAKLL